MLLLASMAGNAQERKYSTFYYQRATLFEELPVTSKDIIFLGNSITNGGEWSELLNNKHVKNRGISGDICMGVYDRLDAILKGKPAKIFLLIGINDVSRGTSADTIVNRIGMITQKIKQDSPKTIRELKAMNIKETVMLTGDKKEVGEYVAKKLNMDKVYTELLPDGKVEKVEELLKQKSEKGKLVFVGDGINDAPVLTISDIGVAMGGLGSDAAIEAADIVIMTDETSKISKAINLSKKTMRIVRENIIFAIFVKIAVLVLTAFGASTMWEAVFADVGVSVIAIINALRMLNIKKFE